MAAFGSSDVSTSLRNGTALANSLFCSRSLACPHWGNGFFCSSIIAASCSVISALAKASAFSCQEPPCLRTSLSRAMASRSCLSLASPVAFLRLSNRLCARWSIEEEFKVTHRPIELLEFFLAQRATEQAFALQLRTLFTDSEFGKAFGG